MTFCVTDPDLALVLAEDGSHLPDETVSRVLPFVAAGLLLASIVMLALA
jgi:hypothetical protein